MHRSLLSAAWAAVLSGALVAQAPEPSPTPATSADPLAVLAALPLAATPTRGVRIVVRDANGAPAKAAQLVFVASDEPRYLSSSVDASSRSRGDEPSYWALRVASGARFAVDDYGNARVPAVDGRVFAWHDGIVATKAFTIEDGKPPSRVDLDLKPPLEFVVTVVGKGGAPVHGVPVGVVAGPRSATLPRARTDVQGRIAFRLLPMRNAEARLRLGAATKQSIEVPLPTHGGEARLQLPECGSVRVTFADELVPGATIRWTLMRADRTFEPTATEERAALFDFVETGFEGTARAALPSGTLTAPVPAVTAGAQSTVALERSAKEQIVTLRVLDPNGEPVRSSFVSVEWRHERRQHGNPGRTTSEGWLELVRPTHAANADRLVIDMRGRNPEDPPIGRIELPLGAPDPGRIDRGEHRLVPAKPLLAGVLVEADGRPIPWVRLQAASEDQPGATSDAAGRFVFRAMEREQAALRLTVESPGWFFPEPASRTRTVDAGVDVKLVLQDACASLRKVCRTSSTATSRSGSSPRAATASASRSRPRGP